MAIFVLLLVCSFVLVFPCPPVSAQGVPNPEGLDTPLLAANMCGSGAPGETHFTIAATGDLFPHENIQAAGEAYGYDWLFDPVRPFLQAADLAYTNFDGAMLEGSPHTGYPQFNYSPALAPALKNAGIDIVSTANNHILDRGAEGLDATMAVLDQVGIGYHGTVRSDAPDTPRPAYLPLTLVRDGVSIRVAFLSFSWGTNGIPDLYGQVNLLWRSDEYGQQGGVRQEVLDAIAQARREADLVVVAAHWGYEYQFYPDGSQIEGARQMAAAGADVILGAQPHTLQPVDIIDTNGHKALVIYSLGNFLASQGAYQADLFTATSVVFYVGVIRHADGTVGVSGFRYLPTIHVDGDTRPAPFLGSDLPVVQEHVRLMMRDFGGARQIGPDLQALGEQLAVCPRLADEGAGQSIGGDFVQHMATLGTGTAPASPTERTAVFGQPLGSVVVEKSGDCQGSIPVLYTERQRLELHAENPWPYRVLGTPIGAALYQSRYGAKELQRRTNLSGDAIADGRFRAFFERYGGLNTFGFPISGLLTETIMGQQRTVQYFERARFELNPAPTTSELLDQVQLGLLGREYLKSMALCEDTRPTLPTEPTAGAAATMVADAPTATPPATTAEPLALTQQPAAEEPGQAAPSDRAALPLWRWVVATAVVAVEIALIRWLILSSRRAWRRRNRRTAEPRNR